MAGWAANAHNSLPVASIEGDFAMPEHDSVDAEMHSVRQLLQLINASWMSQALHVAARLGLADLLAAGPRSTLELAASTQTSPRALYQLLRALCTLGICHQLDGERFQISSTGTLLGSHARFSVRGWAIYWGGAAWKNWEHLLYSVRSGASARALVTGAEGFAHLDRDPEAAAIFNQAMVDLTRIVAHDVVRSYDFGSRRVIDVGGGYGELLAAILAANPAASGVLLDRPHAISQARGLFGQRGLEGRCAFVAGDFFESVPPDGDLYVLKSIIHDWDDERAAMILKTCRRNMPPAARVLLIERVMPHRMAVTSQDQLLAQTDLNMLVALGSYERTAEQYSELLSEAGFRNVRFSLTGSTFSLMEAEVAQNGVR